MRLSTRLLALAAVAALTVTTSACATRQTTTDSQTATGPGATQPATPAAPGAAAQPGVTAQPDQATTPGVTARAVPTEPSVTPSRPGASVTVTTPGGAVSLTDVFFAFDESTLSGDARRVLETNAEYLRRNPRAHVQIEGHADERGSTAYNLALGDRRATAAKRYLESLGVDPSRASTISFGEEKPFAQGQSEEAWAQNRRGHFVEAK